MDTRVVQKPFERFGVTKERFRALDKLHIDLNETLPKDRSSDDHPMYDWEAEKVKMILDHFHNDEVLCSVVCALLQLVQDDVTRKRTEAAAKFVPKPERANTVGMFFPSPEEKATA